MHESLDEFRFRPDSITDSVVICPGASEKLMYNVVNTLAPSFLIKSSSFLQVRRTTRKSGMSLKFSLIGPCTAELAALECLKKSPRKQGHALKLGVFEFQPDPTTDYGVTCPLASEKSMYNVVNTLAPSSLIGFSSFLHKV